MNASLPPKIHPWRMLQALFNLTAGVILGLLLLEAILRVNPRLLVRGMALPAPIDPPLTVQEYDVRYSDADAFFWRPDLIRPIPAGADSLEAHVRLQTDELGFRNDPPLPEQVDVVVLGRSISLGAQQARPWPQLLTDQTGWQVWNLSQPGSSMDVKETYLHQYAALRRPRWVVVEVQPSIDILAYATAPGLLVEGLLPPVIQYFGRPLWLQNLAQNPQPVYPLTLDLPGRQTELTCCLHYLDTLTVDAAAIRASQQWRAFSADLERIRQETERQGACLALLYAPAKPDIYFPLAVYPEQLNPTLTGLHPLQSDQDGRLVSNPMGSSDVATIRSNVLAGRDVLAAYAQQHHLLLLDPAAAMTAAVRAGQDPFMRYDSHWNAAGHRIVADLAARTLQDTPCP